MADHPEVPESFRNEHVDEHRFRWWLLGIGVVLVVAVVVASVFAFKKKLTPEALDWPKSTSGRPAGLGDFKVPASEVKVTSAPGVYIWNDFDGWHLWVVNGTGVSGVKGSIRSDVDAKQAGLAVRGTGTVSLSGSTIDFDLPATPRLVGVDFQPGFFAKKLTITLTGPNGPIAARDVTIGLGTKAKAVPVVIDKLPPKDAATS